MENLSSKTIFELEREMWYLRDKADHVADLITQGSDTKRITITFGFGQWNVVSFASSDLFSADMELTMLGQLEKMFRSRVQRIETEIRRKKQIKILSDGSKGSDSNCP